MINNYVWRGGTGGIVMDRAAMANTSVVGRDLQTTMDRRVLKRMEIVTKIKRGWKLFTDWSERAAAATLTGKNVIRFPKQAGIV